jgi:hypothetical protein
MVLRIPQIIVTFPPAPLFLIGGACNSDAFAGVPENELKTGRHLDPLT